MTMTMIISSSTQCNAMQYSVINRSIGQLSGPKQPMGREGKGSNEMGWED